MKKMLFMLATLFLMTVPANAMSYKTARAEALFLTDKMAYELKLNAIQRNAIYEINLDYMMSLNNSGDIYGSYWTHRNLDISYVLNSSQYRLFRAADYFFRPVYWKSGWRYSIYTRYKNRSHFYYGHPSGYKSYKGAHCWHKNGNKSWYKGRNFNNGKHFGNTAHPSHKHHPNNHDKNSWKHGKPGKDVKKGHGEYHRGDKGRFGR
ncbi:hypothetical protein [Xylanibacter caecicola]|uniref:hypothetical protein n=1 Tax=Xylanibacter caecicola TaxID=2736294 RepID=UPI002588506F|nr:hypothetical protein [Xylanibacter caecicola]